MDSIPLKTVEKEIGGIGRVSVISKDSIIVVSYNEYVCYIVKYENDSSWSLFYDSIKGFHYTSGHEYIINVTRTSIGADLQDASSVRYKLNHIISDIEKEPEGIPSLFFGFH